MYTRLKAILQAESEVTAIQYGLIVAAVSAAIITAFATFQRDLSAPFADISEELITATTSEPLPRGVAVRPTRPNHDLFRPSEGP